MIFSENRFALFRIMLAASANIPFPDYFERETSCALFEAAC
jgi:hypothetical protein